MWRLTDFDYSLPEELIAQKPLLRRDSSRLLVLDRSRRQIQHRCFSDITQLLREGDLLILNDTKVIPARLFARRASGGKVEILILQRLEGRRCRVLLKPLARLKEGETFVLGSGFSCTLIDAKEKLVEFHGGSVQEIMRRLGSVPLPPYIRRRPSLADRRRYQTVFARRPGAVAAPTAGLHFTKRLLAALGRKGIRVGFLTLHVNYATFAPVRSEDVRRHKMHKEYFQISPGTIRMIRRVRQEGGRVVAVGTTVCRALEDAAACVLGKEPVKAVARWSQLFIRPPFPFRLTDALITNFHLPRTSLLMLVCAFAGRGKIFEAYRQALEARYRFFSYGDAMLIC